MVPMSPHCRPAASSIARIRNDEVVLPLVPVTPTTARAREGVAGERGGGERHAHPRVGHDRLGHGHLQLALHHDRRRAGKGDRLGREVVAVGAGAAQGAEERPRPASSARWTIEAMGVAAASDPGRDGAADDAPSGTGLDQLLEGHAGADPTRGDGRPSRRDALSVCRENAVMSSNAGAATSPP